MKIQVTQENLNKALNTVAKIANTRGTLPILANILLKTIDNRLSITATNLDIAITRFIGSKITKEGAITVPARLIQDFINSLPSGIINIELEENRLHIETEKYNSIINGVAADEFPVMPAIEGGYSWRINNKILKTGLQQVVIAASNDDTRPVLTGINIHTLSNKLYIAATDSYRLAEKELTPNKQPINLLVPAIAIQELLRILNDYEEDVIITYNDQQALFQTSDTELVTRLIEGTYPDYRQLIPREFITEAVLDRNELINVAKVSSLFARESAGSITLNVSSKNSSLSIHSIASQLGENTSVANAEVKGDGSITLNSRYLLDALSVLSSEKVIFSFNGKLDPVVLRDPKTKDYLHIIMPLKS